MRNTEQDKAVRKAEVRIQKILIDLHNELGLDIDHVRVDTRNFANLAVEIRIDNVRGALFSEEVTNAVINAIGDTEGEPLGVRAASVIAAIRDKL